MKILLTGANGDVGRHLLNDLLAAGHEVTAVVRTAPAPSALQPPGLTWLVADLARTALGADALDGVGAVLHAAGKRYDPRASAAAFTTANVEATRRLLASVERSAARAHVVFFSTMYVYGEGADHPLSEQDTPSPRTPYGASKLEAEREIAPAAWRRELPFTILRMPGVYGTGSADILAQMASAYRRLPPFVIGAGDQRRSLLAIGNLTRIVRAATGNPRWYGATVNIADPAPYRMLDLVRYVAGGRRVRHLPVAWVHGASRLSSLCSPVFPACRDACDRLARLGATFVLDTARLQAMDVGPLECLAVGERPAAWARS